MLDYTNYLYFFSTCSQCIAGITGLFATFTIFKYQALILDVNERAEKISKSFLDRTYLGFLLSDADIMLLVNFVTNKQRAEWLDNHFAHYWGNPLPEEIQEKFSAKYLNNNIREEKIQLFLGWHQEFIELKNTKILMNKLRWWVICSISFGLFLIGVGILGTIAPSIFSENDIMNGLKFYSAGLIIYGFISIKTVLLTFQKY